MNNLKSLFEVFSRLIKITLGSSVLVISHDDMDGFGPSIIMKALAFRFKNLKCVHTGNAWMSTFIKDTILREGANFDYIIVCDISVEPQDAIIINSSDYAAKVVMLDHHKSALDKLSKYNFPWVVVEPNMINDFRAKRYGEKANEGHSTGTSLLWAYLEYCGILSGMHKSDRKWLEELVFAIAAFDGWDWEEVLCNEYFYNLNTVFNWYKGEMFEAVMLDKFHCHAPLIGRAEKLAIKMSNADFDKFMANVGPVTGTLSMTEGKFNIAYCQCEGGYEHQTDIFQWMKKTYPGKDFYVINYINGLSFRSNKGMTDVQALITPYGGGGHPGSAGFRPKDGHTLSGIKEFEEVLHASFNLD